MEVLCVGMYRACSTWQYNICAELVERKMGGDRLGFVEGGRYQSLGDEADGRWRVLKAHEGHEAFARVLREGRARAVYSRRDLRDVTFSLMHKFSKSFDEVVAPGGMLEICLQMDRFWPSLPNVLCQNYERIVADPVGAILQIADHLEFDISAAEAQELAEEFSTARNRERVDRLARELRAGGVDLDDSQNVLMHNTRTLLHWNHLRDGAVGGWRVIASPEQRVTLARICGPWLRANGYDDLDPGKVSTRTGPSGRSAALDGWFGAGGLEHSQVGRPLATV